MVEKILSAGIDVGTSTTQLIFSRITIENTSGFGAIPKLEIKSKEILYKSKIYNTPLKNENEIDEDNVYKLIENEYEIAGINPKDLNTGAVIITGETVRKKNAREVADKLSQLAGEFVVVTAGPDLESILAGKGSGASTISKYTGKIVANLDIGGGTTNICIFKEGQVIDTTCLDIGGRLIKIKEQKIIYISEKMKKLISSIGLSLRTGEMVNKEKIILITRRMTEILEEITGRKEKSKILQELYTNHGLLKDEIPEVITFSGGVAACFDKECNDYEYDDIGVIFANEIKKSIIYDHTVKAKETVRATVIGAGNFSMDVSGSTIGYYNCKFPYKNLPVIFVKVEKIEDVDKLLENVRTILLKVYEEKNMCSRFVLAFNGIKCPSFFEIEKMSEQIIRVFDYFLCINSEIIVVSMSDTAKALAQAIRRKVYKNRMILCIDGIKCNFGDYIDIGKPIASGQVVPIVVKTLIFDR